MNKDIERIMKQQAMEFYRKYGYPACTVYSHEELIDMATDEWNRQKNSYWNRCCAHSLDKFLYADTDSIKIEAPEPPKMTRSELEDRICELIVKLSDERVKRERAEAQVDELETKLSKLLAEKIRRNQNDRYDDPRY